MAARKQATPDIDKRNLPAVVNEVERAEVAVPAPGIRFHILSKDGDGSTPSQINRLVVRQKQAILHYEMFRTHPTIRAAIEKITKTATATGYVFTAPRPGDDAPADDKKKELDLFLRHSNGLQLLRSTYRDLLIFGDAYWWVQKTRGGRPFKAMRLHPAFVEIKTDGLSVTGYTYGGMVSQGGAQADQDKAKKYRPDEIIHFKFEDPASDLYGLSLLESLEAIVAVDLYAINFNGKFFENSAQTGTIFSLKSTDAGEIARNREYLEQNYVGSDNAHRPLLLEGDIDVKKSVSTPQEMQFIEGRKLLREEMLEVLDVPHDKLGIIEHSNRSVAKEGDNTFRTETVAPIQQVVEEEINNRLVLEMFGWDDIVFAHNEVSTRDSLANLEMLAKAETLGILSVNDIRDKQFGLKPVPGGDQNFIQTAAGVIPLELLDDVAMRLVLAGAGGAPAQGPTNPANPTAANPPGKPASKKQPAGLAAGDGK